LRVLSTVKTQIYVGIKNGSTLIPRNIL
jgi:hypothetical protein